MKPPKFTDLDKFPRPYTTAKQSEEPGYLAKRFEEIKAEQERIASDKELKVRAIQKARG